MFECCNTIKVIIYSLLAEGTLRKRFLVLFLNYSTKTYKERQKGTTTEGVLRSLGPFSPPSSQLCSQVGIGIREHQLWPTGQTHCHLFFIKFYWNTAVPIGLHMVSVLLSKIFTISTFTGKVYQSWYT